MTPPTSPFAASPPSNADRSVTGIAIDIGGHLATPVTIDMDVGGTFTDGYFAAGHDTFGVKVDTTPHDLAVCFWSCLEAGATRLGLSDVAALLARTVVLRFSTTVGTNAILQGTGPRVGVISTAGHGEALYGPEGNSPLLGRFVPRGLVASLAAGAVESETFDQEVRDAVRQLMADGARHVVVSLSGSGLDATMEKAVRESVRRSFPTHYLGAVRLLLSNEVRPRVDDFTRTNVAVINAYLHRDLASSLYRAEDRLRADGYQRPLLVTHSNGGAARVAKTRAVDTYNSGPIAGLFGCARFAQLYGLQRVVTVDVGGTSTDIGVLESGNPVLDFTSSIAGVPVDLPVYRMNSVAGGGGSIARVGDDGDLRVGPTSAGAVPGPAAYGLGGSEATVTDAALVLGYLDPHYFLGGRRGLDTDAAERAVRQSVAEPLSIDVAEAAERILASLQQQLVDAIRQLGGQADPDALFVFGGAGGLVAAGLSREIGVPGYLFRHGAVLNAYGSSQMDVVHVYERSLELGRAAEARHALAGLFADLESRARRDMDGEGFAGAPLAFEIELEVPGADRPAVTRWTVPPQDRVPGLAETVSLRAPSEGPVTVRLRVSAAVPHAALAAATVDHAGGPKAERPAMFDAQRLVTAVYDRTKLAPGQTLQGPALVDSDDTTVVLPPRHVLRLDELMTAVIQPEVGH